MWVTKITALPMIPEDKYCQWMEKPYHLAAALRRVCDTLTVTVLNQAQHTPLFEESLLLDEVSCPGEASVAVAWSNCYVREILLQADGVVVCYARCALPQVLYAGHHQLFTSLGGKLLGETVLYRDANIKRSRFEYGCLQAGHRLFQHICDCLRHEPAVRSPVFWARRSLFYLAGRDPLLVVEVFTHLIPEFVA